MILVPLQAVPNQTLAVTLARQNAQLAVRQNGSSIYLDLISNGTVIVRTRVCRDRQRLLLDVGYKGFIGDFAFVDMQGRTDPQYRGLADRYRLYYLEAGE
jgi:hypothetical protein